MKTVVSLVFQTSLVAFVYYMGSVGYSLLKAAIIYVGIILAYAVLVGVEVAAAKGK